MRGLFSIDSPLWHFINKLLYIFLLNLLWLICSLPVFTMGASTTAAYYVALKLVKDEEGYITQSFFRGFKTNFKQATIIWVILLAVGLFLGIDLSVYLSSSSVSPSRFVLMTVFFAAAVAYVLECIYVFPVLARFDNTIKRTMANAFLMAIRHLPYSILILTSNVIVTAIGFLLFPPVLFLGFGLMAFINSWFFVRIFCRY